MTPPPSPDQFTTRMPADRAELEAMARKLMEDKQFRAPASFALCFIDAILEAGWKPPSRIIEAAIERRDPPGGSHTPLTTALGNACEFAWQHGVDGLEHPHDFGLQRSDAGYTHATYVDAQHAVTVVVRRSGTVTFAVAELDWIHNDHADGRPACTRYCGECPRCCANPCCCTDDWTVYRHPRLGDIRRKSDDGYVAAAGVNRATLEHTAAAFADQDNGYAVAMRNQYNAAIALLDEEEDEKR